MRKNVCASMVRKEIMRSLIWGLPALSAGMLLVLWDCFSGLFSGQLWELIYKAARQI